MYLFTFKQIVPRLIEQDDVISYEGALKMVIAQGAGMVCTGPDVELVRISIIFTIRTTDISVYLYFS